MPQPIPFNKPFITGNEMENIAKAVQNGDIGSDGPFAQACNRLLQKRFGIRRVLMMPSGTAALELATMLAGVGPGDEVILPSFTFSSTANAIIRLGAKPVFIDLRPDTLNMDERALQSAITTKTKAVIPVHYAGIACEMNEINSIARQYGLFVIEDAAQAVNGWYGDRALGSIGHLGAYSFHSTKNYVCGEGGALCINAPELVERAEIIRNKGTNRNQFLRGEVDKYTWVDTGSSYLQPEVACAFLHAQLEAMDSITQRRRVLYQRYEQLLRPLESENRLRLPGGAAASGNYHIFYIVLADHETRDALLTYLNKRGIGAAFHYVPLHSSPMGRKYGYTAENLPVTEDLSARMLRLPLYPDLTEADQSRVAEALSLFLGSSRHLSVGRSHVAAQPCAHA